MNGFCDAGSGGVFAVYQSFLMALEAAFDQAAESSDPTMPAVRGQLNRSTALASSALTTSCKAILESSARQIINDALQRAGADTKEVRAAVEDAAFDQATGVLVIIATAAQRDIEVVLRRWRAFAFHVEASARAGMPKSGAIMAARITDGKQIHASTQIDRSGRKWTSPAYVHATARGYLVTTWVESFLYASASRGVDLFKVVAGETDHKHQGQVFTLSGRDKTHPCYADLKLSVWHPNSKASIEAYHAA